MKAWFAAHLAALRLVAARLARTPLATLFTAAAIGVTLSLPAGLFVVLDNLGEVVRDAQSEPQLTLFLRQEAGQPDVQAVRDRLTRNKQVRSTQFIGRDAALKELQKNADLGDLTAGLDRNPLPDAFVVHPAEAGAAQLERLQKELAALPQVASVQLDSAWAQRFQALVALGRQAVLVLAALLAFALLAVTGNTVRLQILTLREEIEVSKLIGATDRFIRRPFLYHGAMQGLLGGLAGLAVVAAGLYAVESQVSQLAGLYGSAFRLHFLAPGHVLVLLGLAAVLGWFGAYLAVSRHLRQFDTPD